jgi:hypothetical protein
MSTIKVTVTFKREEADDCDSRPEDYLGNMASNYLGCTPDEIAKYVAQDQARLEAYYAKEWCYIGIRAVATIRVYSGRYVTEYTLKSPGVWGIESDSDSSYLDEVYLDECNVLRADIEAMKQAEFKT